MREAKKERSRKKMEGGGGRIMRKVKIERDN